MYARLWESRPGGKEGVGAGSGSRVGIGGSSPKPKHSALDGGCEQPSPLHDSSLVDVEALLDDVELDDAPHLRDGGEIVCRLCGDGGEIVGRWWGDGGAMVGRWWGNGKEVAKMWRGDGRAFCSGSLIAVSSSACSRCTSRMLRSQSSSGLPVGGEWWEIAI